MKAERIAFSIPEDILVSLRVGVKELQHDMRKRLALYYFRDRRLSLGKAAKLAGMNRFAFMDFLTSEGTALFDYSEDAVNEELSGLRVLRRLNS